MFGSPHRVGRIPLAVAALVAFSTSGCDAVADGATVEEIVESAVSAVAEGDLSAVLGDLSTVLDQVFALGEIALTNSPEEAAEIIAEALSSDTGLCDTLSVDLQPNGRTVALDFGAGCDVAQTGVVTQGTATITVDTSDIRERDVVVDLVISGVSVVGDATLLLQATQLDAELDLDVEEMGRVVFEGEVTGPDEADGIFVLVNGEGTLTSVNANHSIEAPGDNCTADRGVPFVVDGLRIDADRCYASAGVIETDRGYTCQREGARGEAREIGASTQIRATFTDETPDTGVVEVSRTQSLGDTRQTISEEVALPAGIRLACFD